MHRTKMTILLLISIFFMNCNSDDDNSSSTPDATDIGLVTGLNIRMSDVSDAIQLGNPNVLYSNSLFVVFPNPTPEFITIQSQALISDVWFVSANAQKEYQSLDFSTVLNSNLYSEDTIASRAALQFNDLDTNQFLVNVSDLSEGYYKLFIKTNDSVFWDNIYVQGDNFDISEFIDSWVD